MKIEDLDLEAFWIEFVKTVEYQKYDDGTTNELGIKLFDSISWMHYCLEHKISEIGKLVTLYTELGLIVEVEYGEDKVKMKQRIINTHWAGSI